MAREALCFIIRPEAMRPAWPGGSAQSLGVAGERFDQLLHLGFIVADLAAVFSELRAIMAPYAEKLDSKKDNNSELYVDTRHMQKNGKPLFFGAVQVKKAFVSYHLMPVYLKPELLDGMSTELKARMQGKSCFNFSASDPLLLQELAALTESGYASYEEQGFV